jgi:hypothetical protein
MQSAGPKVAARPGGGNRPGFGHFNEEHLEQGASAAAVAQKQLTQQAAQTSQKPGATHPTTQSTDQPTQALSPREVGTFKDELLERPAKDIVQGVKSIFSLHDVLGIHPGDTPEEQEKKKTFNQRFENLTNGQQEVAKKLFQEKMQRQKAQEEEEEQKKQTKLRQDRVSIAPPSSPKKGAVGPSGSGKQRAQQMLERDRQSLGRVAGAN